MTRIKKAFSQKSLISYIMSGDGDSVNIMHQLVKSGTDIIEIGMAFSDPMAEGSDISLANERALANGITLAKTIAIAKEFRENDKETPLILMGYYNPIHAYGLQKFCKECEDIGIDGYIIVDLPIEEEQEFTKYSKLPLIHLISPATNEERIKEIASISEGFLYYIAVKGITGNKSGDIKEIKSNLDIIRNYSKLPIAVGFGIKQVNQAEEISQIADGVVIGSKIVNMIYQGKDYQSFVKEVKQAIIS